MANPETLVQLLQDIVAPLIEADGGELYLVSTSAEEVKLHLAGTCSGCPGAALTSRGVITPALRTASPQVRVVISTGYLIPQGATRVQARERVALESRWREDLGWRLQAAGCSSRPAASGLRPPASLTWLKTAPRRLNRSTGSSARRSSSRNTPSGAR